MRRAAICNAAQNFPIHKLFFYSISPKIDTNCTNSHEFRRTNTTLEINWCNLVNGAEGISDIEGKAATGSGERAGKRASFKFVSMAFCSKGRRLRFKRQPQPPDGKCGCRASPVSCDVVRPIPPDTDR